MQVLLQISYKAFNWYHLAFQLNVVLDVLNIYLEHLTLSAAGFHQQFQGLTQWRKKPTSTSLKVINQDKQNLRNEQNHQIYYCMTIFEQVVLLGWCLLLKKFTKVWEARALQYVTGLRNTDKILVLLTSTRQCC